MAGQPSVYEYLDFRAYLRDYYQTEKQRRPSFSFRFFARQAGFASPNFLKLVIDGQRNLGPDSIPRFCKALKLEGDAAVFFADLVALGQATSVAEKNRVFERLTARRQFRAARKIDGALFEYLSNWYYPVIRELAGRSDFKDDPAWIAKQLRPRITPPEARAALKVLRTLGLIVQTETGELTRGEPTLTTGHEVQSIGVVNYHRQLLERASEAIETVKREERDVSALTVCVSKEKVAELKERIHRFRDELLALADADPIPEIVYTLTIQLFPLSGQESPA